MSDKNKGISPFRDSAFLKGSNNNRKAKGSADNITDKKSSSDLPVHENPSPAKEEDLYTVQSIDIDAFIDSLSGTPSAGNKAPVKEIITENDDDGKTRSFSVSSSVKKKFSGTVSLHGEEKNIKKNIRVLVKSKQSDRHILDSDSEDNDMTNIIDVLSSVKNDNIFEAVDKAVTKGGNSPLIAEAIKNKNKKEKKKRDRQAILTGKALRSALIKSNNTRRIQLVFVLSMFFLSLILSLVPLFYSEGNLLEFMFSNNGRLFSLINIFLLIPLAGVFYKNYFNGIRGLRHLNLNGDSALVLITLFVLIHDIAILFLGTAGADGTKFYTCFAVFAAGAVCVTDYFNTRTALGSLTTVMKSKNLQSVQPISQKKDAAALSKGITDSDEPLVLYSTDVEMGDSLTAEVGARHNESKFYTYSFIAATALSLIIFVFTLIVNKNTTFSLGMLLSTVCLCSPLTGRVACSLLNYISNRQLNKEGSAATHNEGIHLIGKAHCVTMDVSDVFTCEVSSFRLVPGVLMKQNAAAAVAAAVLINADTLPGKNFEDFVKQTGVSLPLTENIQYEEKLGFSAWVAGKRVLVGNREMLIQHSIPVPDEKEERLYAGNKFVMYLVIEGRLTASFLVNYRTLSSVKQFSADFNKTGLVLLLTCKEPYLDHKEIAKRLYLESAAVKILSGKSEALIEDYRKERITDLNGGLLCAKAGNGLLSLIVNAYNLYTRDKFLFTLHIAGQILAACLITLSCVLNLSLFMSPPLIIIFKLIWSLCAYMITTGRAPKIK